MFVRSLRSCKCTTAIALRSFARASPVAQHHVGSVRTFSIIGDTFTKMATNKMESDKGMLDVFTEQELDDPSLVDTKAKERIARASGKTVDEVSRLITFYKQSLIVQQWLALKKSLGERLPVTEPELRVMQENDVRLRAIGSKILQNGAAGRKKGRGRGSPF